MFKNTLRMGRFLVFSCLMAASVSASSVVANDALIAARRALQPTASSSAERSAGEVAHAQIYAAAESQTA